MTEPTGKQQPARARGRLGIVLALLVLAGGGLLWSSALVWAVHLAARDEPLPPVAYAIRGSDAVPMVTASGFIMLAAVVAVLATRTIGRRIIAAVALVTAALTAVAIWQWGSQSAEELTASMLADGVRYAVDQAPQASSAAIGLATVSLVGGAAAAVLLLVTKDLALMGSKYERTTTRPARASTSSDDPQERDRDLWSSLDRGEDPTG